MSDQSRQRLSPVLIQSSIGLLALVGIAVLASMLLWLKNVRFGQKSYRATFLFSDAAGMAAGTRVNYRGVRVGQVVSVTAEPEGVALEVEISPGDRLISSDSRIEAKQSGLIGETSINIVPRNVVEPRDVKHTPLDAECDSSQIICNDSVLVGEDALDTNALIRSMSEIADFFNEPEIRFALSTLAKEAPQALEEISQFSDQAATLLKSINDQGGIQNLRRTLNSVDQAAQDLSQLSQEASTTLRSVNQEGTITDLNRSIQTIRETAEQVQAFLAINDQRLELTLASLTGTSDQIQQDLQQLAPPLTDLLTQLNEEGTVTNLNQVLLDLQTVASNTNTLAENLNQFTERLNDPETILLLQELLESARSAIQNLEKLTADVDEITGDPAVRQELIRIIKGLSGLVSSAESVQQQVEYAQDLNHYANQLTEIAQ